MRTLAHAALVLCVLCDAAFAQETICDPENPACVQPVDPVSSEASEIIEDPENPALTLAAPPTSEPPQSFRTARFLGEWGTRLDVDSAFDGGGEDIVELSTGLDLGLEWEPTQRFRVVATGEFRHWAAGKENPDADDLLVNASDTRAAYEPRLGETYVTWRESFWSLSLGNLVTRWGSTDLVRPGDVINPIDRTGFSALDAPERLPQLTADLSFIGNGWSLQGLVVPFFEADRAWVVGRDSALLSSRNPVIAEEFPVDDVFDRLVDRSIQDDVQTLVSGTRVPDETPRNVSLGLRGSATFANTDVALGWWRGWDRTPFIFADEDLRTLLATILADGQVLEDFDFLAFFVRNRELVEVADSLSEKAGAGRQLFFADYRRLQMFLFDIARYLGPIGVRADVAFFAQKTYLTESFQAVRRPTLAPTLGLSWERIESEDDIFTVMLEGFWNRPFGADSSVTRWLVDEELRGDNDDPLLIANDGVYGLAAAMLWSVPWVDASLQLGGVYNISHGDVIVSASLTRTMFELFDVSLGYTAFEGPDPREQLTLGGIYDNNDQLSLGVSGVF